jgi:hypothetical protein
MESKSKNIADPDKPLTTPPPKKPTTLLDEATKLAQELVKVRSDIRFLAPSRGVNGQSALEIVLEAKAYVLEEAIRAYVRKDMFPQRVNP